MAPYVIQLISLASIFFAREVAIVSIETGPLRSVGNRKCIFYVFFFTWALSPGLLFIHMCAPIPAPRIYMLLQVALVQSESDGEGDTGDFHVVVTTRLRRGHFCIVAVAGVGGVQTQLVGEVALPIQKQQLIQWPCNNLYSWLAL